MTFKNYHIINESAQDVLDKADELHEYSTEEIMDMFSDPFEWEENWDVRKIFTRKFGWAIPSKDAIDVIREYNSNNYLLDLMAGTGYWTHLMKKSGGINVRAYDMSPGEGKMDEVEYGMKGVITGVRVKKQEALKTIKAANRWMDQTDNQANIFMSWPPYNLPIGYQIAQAMKPGTILFYVGEQAGGCTGCDQMHSYLRANFLELATVHIPTFEGIHDFLGVYLKK